MNFLLLLLRRLRGKNKREEGWNESEGCFFAWQRISHNENSSVIVCRWNKRFQQNQHCIVVTYHLNLNCHLTQLSSMEKNLSNYLPFPLSSAVAWRWCCLSTSLTTPKENQHYIEREFMQSVVCSSFFFLIKKIHISNQINIEIGVDRNQSNEWKNVNITLI